MAVDTLADVKWDYYRTQLGYSEGQAMRKSVADLELEFFTNPSTVSQSQLNAHEADTTNVHGIVDTAKLVTLDTVQTITANKTVANPVTVTFQAGTLLNMAAGSLFYTDKIQSASTGFIDVVATLRGNPAASDGIKIRGFAGQTANLQEWQNSAGTILARVDSGGAIRQGSTFPTSISQDANGTTVFNKVTRTAYADPYNSIQMLFSAPASNYGDRDFVFQVGGLDIIHFGHSYGVQVKNNLPFVVPKVTGLTEIGILNSAPGGGLLFWGNTTATQRFRIADYYSSTNYSYVQLITTPVSATQVPSITRGFASQTANLAEWQNSASTVLAHISSSGDITAGPSSGYTVRLRPGIGIDSSRGGINIEDVAPTWNGLVDVGRNGSTSVSRFYVRQGGGTAHVFQALNTSFQDIFVIDSGGFLKWVTAKEQTTVGAAGGAAALPSNPTKYLQVRDSAGTTFVVPAFAAA